MVLILAENNKEVGHVKWYDSKKGYGFIKAKDGRDIFVHYSAIEGDKDEYKSLNENDKVEFEIVKGEKGPMAKKVEVLEEADNSKNLYSSGKGFRI